MATKLYLLVDCDHHRDDIYRAFTKPEDAIGEAKLTVKEDARGRTVEEHLTPSMGRAGWLYYARIGPEGDNVRVVTIELDN